MGIALLHVFIAGGLYELLYMSYVHMFAACDLWEIALLHVTAGAINLLRDFSRVVCTS